MVVLLCKLTHWSCSDVFLPLPALLVVPVSFPGCVVREGLCVCSWVLFRRLWPDVLGAPTGSLVFMGDLFVIMAFKRSRVDLK